MKILILTIILLTGLYLPTIAKVSITAPLTNDTVLVGRTVRVQWDGPDNQAADIYYSTDQGISWTRAASGLSGGYYDWTVPYMDSRSVQVKVVSSAFIPPYLLWEIKDAHNAEVRNSTISPGGGLVVSAGDDSRINVWSMTSLQNVDNLSMPGSTPYLAKFFHGEDSVLIARDSSVVLWDRKSGLTKEFGKGMFKNAVRAIDVHPTESIFAAASYDGTACIFSPNVTAPIATIIPPDKEELYSVKFSNDGSFLLLTGYYGRIYVYDYPRLKLLETYSGHGSANQNLLVWAAGFSPDNKSIVSAGVDKTVRIWDRQAGSQKYVFSSHAFHVRQAMFHPSGGIVLSASLDSTIRQWDASDGAEYNQAVIHHGGQALWAEYSGTGDSIVSCGRDKAIRLWRNFEYKTDFDTAEFVVRLPVTVSIPHMFARTGDMIRVPLVIKKDSIIPEPITTLDATVLVEIPSKLLDIKTIVQHTEYFYPKDTIKLEFSNISLNDTLIKLKSLVLYADIYYDEIRILDFVLSDDSTYFIEKRDGSITIEDYCPGRPAVKAVSGGTPLSLSIKPNPATEFIDADIVLVEDGNCLVELIGQRGEVASVLMNKEMPHGRYSLRFNIKDINSGSYFVKITTPSEFVSRQVLVVR